MPRLPHPRRPSTGTILGFVAIFIAVGGTALAATGQLVNIADGSNAALLAHVTSAGQLKTASAPDVPAKPFSTFVRDYNADIVSGSYNPAWATPTMAKIAIDRITISEYVGDTQPRLVQLYYWT